MDYGFPLGVGLRDDICKLRDNYEVRNLMSQAGCVYRDIPIFIDALRQSAYTSIDWFLENRPEFIEIGKLAIAAALIPREQPEKLFPPGAPGRHWYELLFNTMDNPVGAFGDNKLSIITFNYDRSLEFYLFTVLACRLGSDDKAIDVLSRIPIIHVHGSLGKLATTHDKGREYSNQLTSKGLKLAAKEIVIVGEASGRTQAFQRARQLLQGAEHIVFLGFGYHAESIQRLGLFNEPWDDSRRNTVRVCGTSGMPAHKWNRIQSEVLNGAMPSGSRSMHDVYRFLSEVNPLDVILG